MLKVEMAPIVIALFLIATPTIADGTSELARCELEAERLIPPPHNKGAQNWPARADVVVKPMAESFEYREAGFVDHDCLAVDDTGSDRQARDRIDDLRKARREIVAVASEETHGIRVPPRND